LEKCPKHTTKRNFVKFYWEKLIVYNGILMETIVISVVVSIGRIVFLAGKREYFSTHVNTLNK